MMWRAVGASHTARHVIGYHVNRQSRVKNASIDVASNICRAINTGVRGAAPAPVSGLSAVGVITSSFWVGMAMAVVVGAGRGGVNRACHIIHLTVDPLLSN